MVNKELQFPLSTQEKVNLEEEHSSENGQLISGEVVERQELLGARTVGPIPLHSPLMFDLLVLNANIGIRKEKP